MPIDHAITLFTQTGDKSKKTKKVENRGKLLAGGGMRKGGESLGISYFFQRGRRKNGGGGGGV